MKAYQLKVELLGSEPIIWRRVILPAGATYNNLHRTIQYLTNFQSGIFDCHLYEFNLPEDNMKVTNDEEAYESHQYYKKNKKLVEKRLKGVENQYAEKQLKDLQIIIRKPSTLKIDKYLETYKSLQYTYDFGDCWQFKIILENIVDDYYFGYPTLITGAETAPPEDVEGLSGFYEFREVYQDKSHPEHESYKTWADSQYYCEYDEDRINKFLMFVKYQKTEWNNINHKNHVIIDDKYRKA